MLRRARNPFRTNPKAAPPDSAVTWRLPSNRRSSRGCSHDFEELTNMSEGDGNLPRTRIGMTVDGKTYSGRYSVTAHILDVMYGNRTMSENLSILGWYPGEVARGLFRRLVFESLREER
jgi:hypothetical protein